MFSSKIVAFYVSMSTLLCHIFQVLYKHIKCCTSPTNHFITRFYSCIIESNGGQDNIIEDDRRIVLLHAAFGANRRLRIG